MSPSAKPDELDAILRSLLAATSGMGPSLERAVDSLLMAASVGSAEARRKLVTIAVHDLHELAVRDALAAVRTELDGREARNAGGNGAVGDPHEEGLRETKLIGVGACDKGRGAPRYAPRPASAEDEP